MNIEVMTSIKDMKIDSYEFCRILGILLDNAIEAAQECEEKLVNVTKLILQSNNNLDTLREETNILEFCKSQNVNRKYTLEFSKGSTVTKVQNKTRFYVSTNGGYLDKVANNGAERNSLCKDQKVTVLNSLDDTPISERNINYTYYFKEARKIIDPIKLGIDPNQKGNAKHKIKSGKKAIEQLTGMYEKLFEDLDDD